MVMKVNFGELLAAKVTPKVLRDMANDLEKQERHSKLTIPPGAKVKAPSVIMKAPKVITEFKVVKLHAEERDGKKVFILQEPGYNYRFVRGFIYHNVISKIGTEREKGTGWKWDNKAKVRVIPENDFALLLKGLHSTYEGATLEIQDGTSVQRIELGV